MALPIDPLLPDIAAILAREKRLVLQAPPGAGKTTRVPLALMDHPGKIVMLEPRRLATRAAAERLAEGLPKGTVGYRMRGDSQPGKKIEVVTEGILTRMLQSDPELSGIGTLIFDEFHERSLNADLGLALALEAQSALREDLSICVMSATLDAGPVAALMNDAPVLTAEGRSYPIDIRFLDKPLKVGTKFETALATLIEEAAATTDGSLLAFLPGAGEIRRTAALLEGRIKGIDIRPLYGGLPFAEQRRAIAPSEGRKLVLATAIAETSLTIEGITVVVDGGKARRARFDPASGMGRLVTEKVSKAEATQRAGRAGRLAPGVAYRLWSKAEDGALPRHSPAEIETADLSPLALDLAAWGASAADLPFLTQPPEPALTRAFALLETLGALEPDTADALTRHPRLTDHGRTMARLPMHPRLAHMLAAAGPQAAPLAALLGADRRSDRSTNLTEALRHADLKEAKRLTRSLETKGQYATLSPGAMAALAYPDRIAQRRKGDAPRYLLSGGRGARLRDGDPLGVEPWLTVTDLEGAGREATIRAGLPVLEAEITTLFDAAITNEDTCAWDPRTKSVVAERQTRLGALTLGAHRLKDPPEGALTAALLNGLRAEGLPLTQSAKALIDRAELARQTAPELPDLSPQTLLDTAEDWLTPHLTGRRTLKGLDITPALEAFLTYRDRQTIDRILPAHFTAPTGRKIGIDYSSGAPEIALKLQEMFGCKLHPMAAGQPLKITLLSPAGRPLQTTTDIPGFWTSSYPDVRKDMRGRYPRHPWPEDPAAARPTQRTKPRGT